MSLRLISYSKIKCRGMIPHPETITKLCIQGGVKEEWGTEETYPKASPLTLTGINRGPKKRGKGKGKETQEEKRNERCTELEQWENQCPLQPEAQRS